MTRYLRAELVIGALALGLGVLAIPLESHFLETLAVLAGCGAFTLVVARALT